MDPDALQVRATIRTTRVRKQLERSHTTRRDQTIAAQIYKSSCSGFPWARATSGGQMTGGRQHVLCNPNLTRILKAATHVRTKKRGAKGRALRTEMKLLQKLLCARRFELRALSCRSCSGYQSNRSLQSEGQYFLRGQLNVRLFACGL